jgi:hypothetical protein
MNEYSIPLSAAGQARAASNPYARSVEEIAKEAERARQREALNRVGDNPDQAAEARRIAQQTGVPAPLVQSQLPNYRADQRRAEVAEAARDPRVGGWLSQNAEVAGDDIATLINLGRTGERFQAEREVGRSRFTFSRREILDDAFRPKELSPITRDILRASSSSQAQYRALVSDAVLAKRAPAVSAELQRRDDELRRFEKMQRGGLGQVGGSLGAGVFNFAGGIYGLGANIAGVAGADRAEEGLLFVQGLADKKAAALRGESTNFITDSLLTGVESIPVSIGTVLTGSAKVGLSLFFAQTAGNSYAEARGHGLGVARSTLYGTTQGGIEVATEVVPMKALGDLARGNGAVSGALKRFLIGDLLGEQAATVLQDANSWLTLNPEGTLSEYIDARPEAAARTFFATLSGSGGQAALTYGLHRAFRTEQQITQSQGQLSQLDELMRLAAESKTRGRDPQAFRDLIEQIGGEERLFISGEVIAQFNQSYREDPFWSDYADEIDEAVATGGEVGIPLADAAARLAGTPDWDALGGSARIGAEGMSLAEIEEANATLGTLDREAADEVEASVRAENRAAAPGVKLRENIRGQLMNAGMTPDVASQNAEIVAALFETEAANLGRKITGDEFGEAISVQRELPGLIGPSQPVESLDIIVNAMRAGGEVDVGVGPSLLQFIGQYGGINDTGGDLKSMGVPKRLIRSFDPAQAGMLGLSGAGEYGIDNVFQAAIEAGYFPDLVGVSEQAGPSTLDTNDFLAAISDELGGRKLFSQTREETYRRAGAELRSILDAAGVDADTASIEDIRAAVALFEEGQTFDQADGRILYQGGVQAYERRTPEANGETTNLTLVNSLANAARLARDNRFPTGRELKIALQKIALDGQKADGVTLSGFDDATAERLTDYVVEDALEAVQDNGNAIGWYDRAVTAAKAEMAKLFPEIATDPKSEFAFIWALAVTSNGLKVDKNFELAARAYEAWRDTGSFPPDIGIGQAAQGINDGLALYATLVERLGSWEAARDFMVSEHPVRDIEKMAGIPISGEGKGEVVRGAAILGPKIGNGFFSNLYGYFDSLTMDRWLMRTVGRWRGTLIFVNPKMVEQKRAEIKAHFASLSPEELKYLAGFYNGSGIKISGKMSAVTIDALANETAKRSMAPDWRAQINKAEGGEALRKLGNALAKYLDGQVEAPGGTKERAFIRKVFQNGLARLQEKEGLKTLTMADLQALLWYPEKLLYESAKKPAGEELRGYEDDDAPDYANAARKLVRDRLGQAVRNGDGRLPDRSGLGNQEGVAGQGSQVDERTLNQGDQAPQGQIQFTDAIAIIKLFETANLTTFQHEMAHFWLERFKGNALAAVNAESGAAASTARDWETLKAWFAENGAPVAEDGTIPTEAHELFARSWERYLMEGKSPKTSLNSVFRKVAQWFRSIYRSIKALNAPITPEIREVMDRMLATEEEIAAAAQDRAMMLMFDDAVAAGMTEAEAARYKALGEEARNEAEEELYGKVMRSIRARETKAWKEQERIIRMDVQDMVENRPVFQALAMLRGEYRLDRDWIVNTYGEDALKLLPAGVPPIYRTGGNNADQIAEMVGFKSGDEMVRELMGLEMLRQRMKASGDKRSVKKATIDQEVAEEMHRRFGDPLTDGSIEREAAAAIQNERQGERIEMELRALAAKTNRRPTPYALAREWAKGRIARGVVAETISGDAQYRYTRTATKAAKAATAAFIKGDTAEAFKQKQIEMLHNALAREAAEQGDRIERAVKRMGKLAKQRTVKSLAQDYLDQIHGLLENYEFKQVSQRQINARDAYARWAAEQTAAGKDVVAVERLAQSKNWSRMTVEELLALDEAVKGLVHLGKLKRTLLDNKERRDLDALVGEAVTTMQALPQKERRQMDGGTGWLQAVGHGFLSFNAALRKMEDVFDRLDAKNPRGVFNRVVMMPLIEAQAAERELLDTKVAEVIEAMKEVPKASLKRWQEKRTIDELAAMDEQGRPLAEPATMLGEELIAMALNMGNRGNMEKLVVGRGWDKQHGSIDAARAVVLDVLNRELTPADWQYVQRVWDIVDSLWPALSAMEKRVNGFAPDKVEAMEVITSAGPLRGGYFPVVYDPRSRVGARNLEVEENGLFPSQYYRATTRAGSTRERTEFKGPLHLSLGVLNRHLAEVVHDITHREAIINADKFLSDTRVAGAVIDVVGSELQQQFRPWLQHIANEWAADREANTLAERMVKGIRTNATMVGLGFRISTVMLQISGYSNSAERIGLTAVVRGIIKSRWSPEAWNFALDNSKELRSRMTTMDRDIRDNARRLASKQAGVLDAAQQFAFHGIGYMDRLVTVATWHGAYDKALSEGMDHDDAVFVADKAVRQSQGSGAAKDMARIQRGTGKTGEAWKLMSMFYSFSSAFYQRQAAFVNDTADAVRERDLSAVPDLAARFVFLNIVPALASAWLSGNWPDDDEDEGAWVMAQLLKAQFQGIPIARDIAGALDSGFGYSFTPAEGFGRSVVNLAGDLKNISEGEETKRMTRNTLETIGYATGKVPGQLATSTQFLVDVGYGDQDPRTAAEWWRGITKGKTEPAK